MADTETPEATQTGGGGGGGDESSSKGNQDYTKAETIYDFEASDLDGTVINLSKYKDHVTLVVNVASKCGLTKANYHQLNELYEKLEPKGLRILAFPCNQFMGQEPGCDVDIKEFMVKHNVKFDVFAKIDVNGKKAHPLYSFLKSKQGGTLGNYIKWNFTKFLVNKAGVPVKRYAPTVEPKDIEKDILELL